MKTIRVYSDESRHKNERFLLLGGIWVEEENIGVIESSIAELRHRYGYTNFSGTFIDFLGEFKWTKVSDRYLTVYKELVDIFFAWIDKDIIRACVMLVDTQDPAVISYSNIKKEGYFKLLYTLYLHNSKIPAIYKIYPDTITNPTQYNVDFDTLDNCLEKSFKKKFSPLLNPQDHPGVMGFVNNITPIDSKSSQLIQLIDVIMGCIGYYQNGLFNNDNAKKSKVELMKYVFDKIVFSGFFKFSGKSYIVVKSTKFNIWVFKPRMNGNAQQKKSST